MTHPERIKSDETKDRHAILADEHYYRFFIHVFYKAYKQAIFLENKDNVKRLLSYFIFLIEFLKKEIIMTTYLFEINSEKKSHTLTVTEILEIIDYKNIINQEVLRRFHLQCIDAYKKYCILVDKEENTFFYLKKHFTQSAGLFRTEEQERKHLLYSESNAKYFIAMSFFNEMIRMILRQQVRERSIIEDKENGDFKHFLSEVSEPLRMGACAADTFFVLEANQAESSAKHSASPHQYSPRLDQSHGRVSIFVLKRYEDGELPRPCPMPWPIL